MRDPDGRKITILEAALEEIVDQAAYFETKSGLELADRWGEAVGNTIQSLLTMPHRGSLCLLFSPELRDLRHVPVKGFERYSVFYYPGAERDGLRVVAVLHMSQDIARILAVPRE